MKSASRAGAVDALQRGDHLLGHLRQQLQDLERALLQLRARALDLGVDCARARR